MVSTYAVNPAMELGAGGTGGTCLPFFLNLYVKCPLKFTELPAFPCQTALEDMLPLFEGFPCLSIQ